jgi:membrane-associated phospholipid phosphatase
MPIVHGMELHFRNDEKKWNSFVSIMLFSLFASYLLYLVLPAIGPRFTLHDFSKTSIELPGLYLAEFFRYLVNTGGGIMPGSLDPSAVVNRDCMPSGHTWITMVNIIMAFKYNSKYKWIFLIIGSGLIFGTVYLRYHYVIDLIASFVFVGLTIYFEPKIRTLFQKFGFKKI